MICQKCGSPYGKLVNVQDGGKAEWQCRDCAAVQPWEDQRPAWIDRAAEAARRTAAIVILKGSDSIIAAPDGRVAVATGASSWLSTAGTGDVLAGLAAGRLAVGGDPFRAASESVWLHGEAARRAGAAFVADDLITRLPAAIASRL